MQSSWLSIQQLTDAQRLETVRLFLSSFIGWRMFQDTGRMRGEERRGGALQGRDRLDEGCEMGEVS